jgi:predicted dehydrogenase
MIGCVLRGTRGTSVATYPTLNYYINRDDGQPEKFSYEQRSDYYFRFGGHTHHAGEFQNYLEYFARCLDNNMDPRPNLADGIHVLAVLTAMERALASHKPVTVASVLRDFGLEREEDPALPAQSGLTA